MRTDWYYRIWSDMSDMEWEWRDIHILHNSSFSFHITQITSYPLISVSFHSLSRGIIVFTVKSFKSRHYQFPILFSPSSLSLLNKSFPLLSLWLLCLSILYRRFRPYLLYLSSLLSPTMDYLFIAVFTFFFVFIKFAFFFSF